MSEKVPRSYFDNSEVTLIAENLIGMHLCTVIDGELTKGMIVETEAYCGATDAACHAYPGKRTPRTETMYGSAGIAYVYLCYGMHHLFNIVTNKVGYADAVLIRGVEPIGGVEVMANRSKKNVNSVTLTNGPAKLTKALGIKTYHDGTKLDSQTIWIEYGSNYSKPIIKTTRIGVDYAGEDAKLPWRFYLKDSKFVSSYKKTSAT